jgi:acyl-homoserine lactone acylase PvdQ
VLVDRLALGSNNWAIAGAKTKSGRALVAATRTWRCACP